MDGDSNVNKAAAQIMAGELLKASEGETAGVISSDRKPLNGIVDDTEGRDKSDIQDKVEKILKVDSNLKAEEVNRYKKIFKIMKDIVFPDVEAETLKSKKINSRVPIKGVVEEVSKEKEGKSIWGMLGAVLGTLGSVAASLFSGAASLFSGIIGAIGTAIGPLIKLLTSGLGSIVGLLSKLVFSKGGLVVAAAAGGWFAGTWLENNDMNPIRWMFGMEQKSKEAAAEAERMRQQNLKEDIRVRNENRTRMERLIEKYGERDFNIHFTVDDRGVVRRREGSKYNKPGNSVRSDIEHRAMVGDEEEANRAKARLRELDRIKAERRRLQSEMEANYKRGALEKSLRVMPVANKWIQRAVPGERLRAAKIRGYDKDREETDKRIRTQLEKLNERYELINRKAIDTTIKDSPKVEPLAINQKDGGGWYSGMMKSQNDITNRIANGNNDSGKLTSKYMQENNSSNERIAALTEQQTQVLQEVAANILQVGGSKTVLNTGSNNRPKPIRPLAIRDKAIMAV